MVRENAGVRRDELAGEDLRRRQEQHEQSDHAPGCGPERHELITHLVTFADRGATVPVVFNGVLWAVVAVFYCMRRS